jgi:hypothetical protein
MIDGDVLPTLYVQYSHPAGASTLQKQLTFGLVCDTSDLPAKAVEAASSPGTGPD